MGRGKKWTKRDEMALWKGAGVFGYSWFCSHTGDSYDWPNALKGRSVAAIRAKARALFGGSITRGSYSVRRLCRETGYNAKQIKRAMQALAQKWKRTSPTGKYLIYEDQAQEIIQWLRVDYWSGKHHLYACLWCGERKKPHQAVGLCRRCYQRYAQQLYRAGLPTEVHKLLELIQGKNLDQVETSLLRGRAMPEKWVLPVIKILQIG